MSMDHDPWAHETNNDLEIEERGAGRWWVEDTLYRAPIAGPFGSQELALAARAREVERRKASISGTDQFRKAAA